jgi:AcrR family transcriptional regulator
LAINGTVRERLLAYIDAYFDFITEFPLSPKLVQQEHMRQTDEGADQLHRMVERYLRPVHRKLVALLKEGIAQEEFRDMDIEHCVQSISALILFCFTGNLTVDSMEGTHIHPRRIDLRRKAVRDFICRAVFR